MLRERNVADSQEFNTKGEYQGESSHTREFERLFYALLNNESREADEALAALLHVYIGEHPGEELECEIMDRGRRMLPTLEKFRTCMPRVPGISVSRRLLDNLPSRYPELIEAIRKGEKCEPE